MHKPRLHSAKLLVPAKLLHVHPGCHLQGSGGRSPESPVITMLTDARSAHPTPLRAPRTVWRLRKSGLEWAEPRHLTQVCGGKLRATSVGAFRSRTSPVSPET